MNHNAKANNFIGNVRRYFVPFGRSSSGPTRLLSTRRESVEAGTSHSGGEFDTSTTIEANKRVLRRLFDEVINGHDYDVIDDLFAPDYVNHGPFPANTPDLPSLK